MAVDLNIFQPYLLSILSDERINVWHMAVLFAIIQLATSNDMQCPIFITRKKVMTLAHINSYMTYHKCIKELQQLGYINYDPSYHPALGSKVYLSSLPD